MEANEAERIDGLTWWQRIALRRMLKAARKRPGDVLGPEDWEAYLETIAQPSSRAFMWVLRSLPASPRCGMCGAPFAGWGRRLVAPLGYRPSRKNPNICATCVELAPPGGMTTQVGVLFADLRGFTALSERTEPEEIRRLLHQFYICAEDILFPEALIDKLIGDEVMALYLPRYVRPREPVAGGDGDERDRVAPVMLDHARKLLTRVGYGSEAGPFVDVGIGLDFGEAFVGNIGEGAMHDFTAIGDVVNTAARLQAQARSGEILDSTRLIGELDEPPGEREELDVKGKTKPVVAYRISVGAAQATA